MKRGLYVLFLSCFLFLVSCAGSDGPNFSYSASCAAQQLVKECLVSPSSADFQKTDVIAEAHNPETNERFFLVYISVDAQNAFGVMIREYFIVPILYKNNDTSSFYFPKESKIFKCAPEPTKYEILAAKAAITWPVDG